MKPKAMFAVLLVLLSVLVWPAGATIAHGLALSACVDDTWAATSTPNAPSGRANHTAVWTGTEMIVWGGCTGRYCDQSLNNGGRYYPATDTWAATSTANAPSGRENHTAVWTGTEMIVWGGSLTGLGTLNTGGRYDPATDTWVGMSMVGAPSRRQNHTAVWTGSEMIVWGGSDAFGTLNTGGRYDPATDTWTATSLDNAPSARHLHTAVWTGTEMIVWGGTDSTGGRYNPVTDTWAATRVSGAPTAGRADTAVWTGTLMIVWGEAGGGRYDPATDTWTDTTLSGAPSARYFHRAVWTGTEKIVWGGSFGGSLPNGTNTGGRYDPHTDRWLGTSLAGVPAPRYFHTMIWTGSETIVWGGGDPIFEFEEVIIDPMNTGGRYCASAGVASFLP